jgi:hypothetical protein
MSAFAEPSALRRWLWALAPGLAIALWIVVELVEHLSQPSRPKPGSAAAGSSAPAAASVEPHDAPALQK